ncbi:MAG: hypothetical protein H6711_03345 [Myxococcales bacterium]|nr:hypothetical protein [Myxococcales bacterium]
MQTSTFPRRIVTALSTLALVGGLAVACDDGDGGGDEQETTRERAQIAGAGYTTFDVTIGGCHDGPNGVDCNNYESKEAVFMSGGPSAAGLSDGSYYFAVLAPGYQNGGFIDGAEGNLSDTVAGGTSGDEGRGDAIENRTFRVENHEIVEYTGTHAWGESPQGRKILQLMPYDDTDNPGGVYIMAICAVDAISPSECKYDAFRIRDGGGEPPPPPTPAVVSGGKYYDANTNGIRDEGEVGLEGWMIDYSNGEVTRILTDADGNFSVELDADTYTFAEVPPAFSPSWRQTGNLSDQSTVTGGAYVMLNYDMSYDVTVIDGSGVAQLWFGNVCVGGGGGLTLGFWSNKNGAQLIGGDDLAMLAALNLVDADGNDFDPADAKALSTWLRNGTATNMAYMLSVQLSAMELNVFNSFVDPNALVYAPGSHGANTNGFITVDALMTEANDSLGADTVTTAGHPQRAYQEALKNGLDNANNNRTFAQPSPATCPKPIFIDPELPEEPTTI